MYKFREASELTILCRTFYLHEQFIYNFHYTLKTVHEPKMLRTTDLDQPGNYNFKN